MVRPVTDILTGGGGSDVFVFGGDDGVDQITDFNPDEDTLILSGVETADDLNVMAFNGKTIVAFGNTSLPLTTSN
ncbi:MAG: hypothetical protein JEY79_06735 [Pseudodesulfovibrio sp.]|nr:hypothetical protein [Pseudodesulfovibrio sp.]